MNDVLDDRLRTLMTTAVADAPDAPPLELLGIVEVRPDARSPWHRPVLAAAAVLVVVVAVLAVRRPDTSIEPADTTAPTVVEGALLDAYYLPSDLPDGWRVIDITSWPAPPQTDRAGNTVLFERQGDLDRAVVSLSPASDSPSGPTLPASDVADTEVPPGGVEPEPAADSPDTAQWSPESRSLGWTDSGQFISIGVRSGDEAVARELATSLVFTSTAHGRSVDVAAGVGWSRVKEYLLDGSPVASYGSNSITLGTTDGASVFVTIAHDGPTSVTDLALPVEGMPGVFDYSPGNDLGAARLEGDVAITAFAGDGSGVTQAELRRLVTSMRRVDVAAWTDAATAADAALVAAPVVSQFSALGHDVTVHIDGALRGVCVTTTDASGCQRFGGIDDAGRITPAMPTTGIAMDDGTWVAVGSIGDDRTACAADQLGGAQMAVTSNGDQRVAVVVPADLGQAFACSLQGPDGPAEPFIANTPASV